MSYQQELHLFIDILKNLNLIVTMISSTEELKTFVSSNFFSFTKSQNCSQNEISFQDFMQQYQENIIYRIQNTSFYFLLFQLPEMIHPTYVVIGPYILVNQDSSMPTLPHQNFSSRVSVIFDEGTLLTIVNTFGEHIWGDFESFSLQNIETPEALGINSDTDYCYTSDINDTSLILQLLEQSYKDENELLKIVSQGQWNKAEIFFNNFFSTKKNYSLYPWENTLEGKKNQCIILNTLLRKTAEFANVPPFHIESLFSQFLTKTLYTNHIKDIEPLQKEIIRKYCHLVQTYSLKGYSPIIKKVITHITSNLSGDLSLNGQAKLLNVNPSYLSALFKKETGSTLTDYVKRQRMNHAVFLLNTSSLQIQTIAQYCGIDDVNYFTKIFKKFTGKTPKEYRNDILS